MEDGWDVMGDGDGGREVVAVVGVVVGVVVVVAGSAGGGWFVYRWTVRVTQPTRSNLPG
jgi:hypothetical protein